MKNPTKRITPKTKVITINILARHVLGTDDFFDNEYCALAQAIRDQLKLLNVSVGVDFFSIYLRSGMHTRWRIVNGYRRRNFQEDIVIALESDDDTIVRTITAYIRHETA